MRALQLFTNQSLEHGRQLSSYETLKLLEQFRLLNGRSAPTKNPTQCAAKPVKTIAL